MAFSFPVSLEIGGRRCVVIGGGAVAEQKVRSLLDAGALVTVVAPAFTAGLRELARRAQGSAGTAPLELVARPYREGDLAGAFLAIAATDDGAVNGEVFAEAERSGVLLNAVDDVAYCHFAFPSVLRRGDFALAISTGGKAPALAKGIRRRLSTEFGPEYGLLVELLADVRAELMPRTVEFEEWARRWERALEEDLPRLVREGRVDDARRLVRASLQGDHEAMPAAEAATAPTPLRGTEGPGDAADRVPAPVDPARGAPLKAARPDGCSADAWMEGWELPAGSVSIVGAGPGDPDLITVRGRRALDAADVVVHDRLVHPALLEGKRTIFVGKEAGRAPVAQTDINELLVSLAREGLRVVRLKGGDPFVFGRGAEEAEALAAAGIDFEVVPAPTSAIAAPAYAGIPITDRRCSSSVAIATGHRAAGPAPVDWAGLARSVDTIVVLMGIRRLADIVGDLLGGGLDPATPSAVIEQGTLPNQRVVSAPLGELAAAAREAGVQSPAVVVIGEVVELAGRVAWFDPQGAGPASLPARSAGRL